MKKNLKIRLIIERFFSFLSVLLLFFYLYSNYKEEKANLYQEIMGAFKEAIKKDLESREKSLSDGLVFGITNGVGIDSTVINTPQGKRKAVRDATRTTDERFVNAIQTILYDVNPPKVETLDSLFRQELNAKQIHVQSAVMLIDRVRYTQCCSVDALDLFVSVFSKPYYIGSGKEIELQAYARISTFTVWRYMPIVTFVIVLSWMLFVVALLTYIPYQRKKTKKQLNEKVVEVCEQLVKQMIVADNSTTQETTRPAIDKFVALTPFLLFDLVTNRLFYHQKEVVLKSQSAKTFHSFVTALNYSLTRE